MNVNITILAGRLTRDCETRYANSGTAIGSTGIAVNRKFQSDGQSKEEVLFVDLKLFGKTAENFAKFHRKGSAAFVRGRLTLEQWDDKNTGAKRSKHVVVVEAWEFAESKGSSGQGQDSSDAPPPQQRPSASVPGDVDDTPF